MSGRRMHGRAVPLGGLAIALEALVALAIVALLLWQDGVRLPLVDHGDWHLQVAFADAAGLSSSDRVPVLVAGVPVGRVESVRYERGLAVASLRLTASARGVVRSDAVANIEPRSALNDETVNIAPGSPSATPARPGSRIPPARSVAPVALDRVVGVLDSDTRAQMAILLDQLAAGLRGRAGPLRSAVARLAPTLDSAGSVARTLARRRVLLAHLVDATDRIATVAAAHQSALGEAVRAGRATLDVTAAHDAALAASVRQLPGTLTSLDRALASAHSLAEPLGAALAGLRPMAHATPLALASARSATPVLTGLADDIARLESEDGGSIATLSRVAPQLAPTASLLREPVARLEPIVKAIDANRAGVGQLGERFGGVLSTNDANGPILRGLGSFEAFNPADVGEPGATGAARAALAAKAAKALANECVLDNPVACLVRYLVPGLPGSVR